MEIVFDYSIANICIPLCLLSIFISDGFAFVDKNIKSYDPETHSFYDIEQIARSAYKWVLTNSMSIKIS